ncbi:hypothetical protein VM1G_06460 [Cytospora mali]|uniref:Uncharacterized protein n=1 Tax=Cytospora mali TaxID=578113 RepID=A0A194W2S6_CYTMA|nr:hypothetical protein VM1G_06460 [Valsa mali]
MPSFSSHHCTTCRRVGDKRCIALGHYLECPNHPGTFYSQTSECVKCVQFKKREQRLARMATENENTKPASCHKKDKAKEKAPHKKTMKQLRKEQRDKRKSNGSS